MLPGLSEPRPHRAWWVWPLRFGLIFIVFFIGLFLIANSPGLLTQLQAKRQSQQTASLPEARYELWRKSTTPADPTLANNELFIPRLNLRAPLQTAVDNTPSTLNTLLHDGVVHLSGTALPGEVGNAVVAGHSSAYVWDHAQHFGTIFAALPQLSEGDLIWINQNGQSAGYALVRHLVVSPIDTSILSQTNEALLTLFTCYPIGTTLSRYVVIARLIEPNIALPSTQAGASDLTTLPKIR